MKKALLILFVSILPIVSCKQGSSSISEKENSISSNFSEYTKTNTAVNHSAISSRFKTPDDFKRISLDSSSFGFYLRSLPLKPLGSKVTYYNGKLKANPNIYAAVIDLPIGTKNLHQCADAVIRLRAAYLFQQKKYADIHFNFTNGFKVDYTEWMQGKRILVSGNNVFWKQKYSASNTKTDFWNYLETIFTYAGTASLSEELESISITDLGIGDVFIQGGFPGHAVIVVDVAIHKETSEKIFLLAQSYMPAQELQILQNPNNSGLSPWYSAKILEQLRTPEWSFKKTDLKRFVD